ncbi:MAG: hypothetical protein QOC54_3752 [Baekduia sp.]|nr:hypothetical protein [Baekduia sp.]
MAFGVPGTLGSNVTASREPAAVHWAVDVQSIGPAPAGRVFVTGVPGDAGLNV